MAQKTLMVSYGNQLHKCHLQDGTPKELTVGSHWSCGITFFTLEDSVRVEWDGNECHVDGQSLSEKKPFTITSEQPLRFYLTDPIEHHILDIAGKNNITVGSKAYDDITIEDVDVDFLLIREDNGHGSQLEVHTGEIFHNFSRVNGDIRVEPGDQLFFDGIVMLIREEDMQIGRAHV